MNYKARALILHHKNFGEADRLLVLYSKNLGKIRLKAKGVRRIKSKFGGVLEPLNIVDAEVANGKTMDVITNAGSIKNYGKIKGNLKKVSRVQSCFEVLDKLVGENFKDTRIFILLIYFLDFLSLDGLSDFSLDIISLIFKFRLLFLLGFKPELTKCASCNAKLEEKGNQFSFSSGGVFCEKCKRKDNFSTPISSNGIKLIRVFFKVKFNDYSRVRVEEDVLQEVSRMADSYIESIVESKLKANMIEKQVSSNFHKK